VLIGRTRVLFRDGESSSRPTTGALAPAPSNLTRMERSVLIELCRPLLSHNAFQPPASVREIGTRLSISKNGVQFHLTNLYGKFGIHEDQADRKRVALANEAVQRAAVTLADIRSAERSGTGDA
jgi:hypothetical protein